MKGQKALPYIFLLILLIVIIFIIGVKYGKTVEHVNKNVDFLLSITPTKVITPSPVSTKYLTYSNEACGIEFLYPSSLVLGGESSKSAILKQESTTMFQFSCEKNNLIMKTLQDPKSATHELTLKNRTISGKKQGSTVSFQTHNPYTGTVVYISVNQDFFPLLDSSLQFVP